MERLEGSVRKSVRGTVFSSLFTENVRWTFSRGSLVTPTKTKRRHQPSFFVLSGGVALCLATSYGANQGVRGQGLRARARSVNGEASARRSEKTSLARELADRARRLFRRQGNAEFKSCHSDQIRTIILIR